MPGAHEAAKQAAKDIKKRLGFGFDALVVLGSGWSGAVTAAGVEQARIPAEEVHGFPPSQVAGHGGGIVFLASGDTRVLVMLGRVHLYEGHSPAVVTHSVRVGAELGCSAAVFTNAAGGINPDYAVGQPVLISDHLNLTGESPTAGGEWGTDRFVNLLGAYSPRLRRLAADVDGEVREGVYAGLRGPHFETPAEIRMLGMLGADLVGMSTVLEVIAARHCDMEVLGVSLVTNLAAGLVAEGPSHAEVLEAGEASAARVGRLLGGVLERL